MWTGKEKRTSGVKSGPVPLSNTPWIEMKYKVCARAQQRTSTSTSTSNLLPPTFNQLSTMDDAVPSLSTDGVGSRFVSQTEIDSAKARREEQWKAAYARSVQWLPSSPHPHSLTLTEYLA